MVSRLPAATSFESGETKGKVSQILFGRARVLTRNRRNPRIDRASFTQDDILNLEIKHTVTAIDIPNPRALVARAGNEELSVPGKVERVDFLIVARQEMLDSFFRDIPDLRRG